MNTDLIKYYKDRANEYEKIYSKPERQTELNFFSNQLQEIFANKTVFEVACGTGYWTERIAETANHITATDINETVLEIARNKNYPKKNVSYLVFDLYTPINSSQHDNLFAGFIWSHVKKQELLVFINSINKLVKKGGLIVIMDNNYVEGSNHPITETDSFGNTYQTRKLEDESSHLILKNFPDEPFLRQQFNSLQGEFNYLKTEYFWMITFKKLMD